MKSTTYARLALLFPYLTLIESLSYFHYHNINNKTETLLQNINFAWNFFAFFWFIPYILLTTGLLVWSRSKTIEQIKHAYISAPVTMMYVAFLTFAAIFVISSFSSVDFIEGAGKILFFAAIVSVPASLIMGYLFVGISLLLYKLLQKINFIRD
ncbi:MAG: hypothetical protein ABI986_14630 [Chloroflexota bacterium]